MNLTTEDRERKWELFEQGLKWCRKCDRVLPLDRFGPNRNKSDGKESACRECKAKRARAYREKKKRGETGKVARRIAERKHLAQFKLKRCPRCGYIFPYEHFHKNKGTPDGLQAVCKDCFRSSQELQGALEYEFKVAEREELARRNLKRCNRCEGIKPRCQFHYNAATWDLLDTICKPCASEKFSIYYSTERSRMRKQRRRAKKANAEHSLTKEDWQFALEYFEYSCAYCGRTGISLCQEHFVPLAAGGGYTKRNILPACKRCNYSKHQSPFNDWINGRGRRFVKPGATERVARYFAALE